MYKIITMDNQPIYQVDVLPLKLILHPTLKPEDVKLIAYIIDEYFHNARSKFHDIIFKNRTGVTRSELTSALIHLLKLEIISDYSEDFENDSGKIVKERVIELDYTRLLEVVEMEMRIVKAGTSKRAIQHRKKKSLSKSTTKNTK